MSDLEVNTAKERQWSNNLRRRYGISADQYRQLLQRQNYSCAICQRHESEFPIRLAVEHNHKTREIFGLCCSSCNRYIIGRHKDPDLIQRLAEYLRKGTGWFVPEKKRVKKRKPK